MEKKGVKEPIGIVTFDLETTGIEVAKDRIVQIAIVRKSYDGKIDEKRCVMINPTIPIPKEATDVHGITNEMVKDCPTFDRVAKSFFEMIDGWDISGYNILGFDIPLLVEEFLRSKIEFSFENTRFIDVMNIYKKLNPRDLGACYKHYTGEELDGAHDALIDTEATATILDKMIEKEESLKGLSMGEISEMSLRNKNIVDFAGKFLRNEDGIICFNFGSDRGKPVSKNVKFLDWILGKDFTMDTKNWATKLKEGKVI